MPQPTTPDTERRAFVAQEFRISRADGQPLKIEGYAAVFNMLSEDLGGFREQLSAGAFSEVLNDDVRALFNHDGSYILGRTRAKTLRLWEDSKGLGTEIILPDTQVARDLAVSVDRGDVTQMSFQFTVTREGQAWAKDGDGPWIRTIKRVARLYDVSPVTFPAYPETEAALRSLKAYQASVTPPAADHQLELLRRRTHLRGLEVRE